jgi:hypothetical protein
MNNRRDVKHCHIGFSVWTTETPGKVRILQKVRRVWAWYAGVSGFHSRNPKSQCCAKSTIETKRYCRSRAYIVYSTYSLRGYHKETTREVDRVLPSRDTLGEKRGKTSNLQCSVDPCSPHLGALKRSLSLDFDAGIRKSPRGDVERGRWRWECLAAGQHGKGWKREVTVVERYLYLKDPECSVYVQNLQEIRSFREIVRRIRPPETGEQICKELDLRELIYVSLSNINTWD